MSGVVLGGHGLFTWGETAKACYETTLRIIQQAADWLAANERGRRSVARASQAAAPARRNEIAARLMPLIRGEISRDERKVGHFTDAPEVLEFVNSRALDDAGAAGNLLPRPFPAHQNPPARAPLRSRRATISTRSPARSASGSKPIAPITRPITSAASAPIRRRCATPTR